MPDPTLVLFVKQVGGLVLGAAFLGKLRGRGAFRQSIETALNTSARWTGPLGSVVMAAEGMLALLLLADAGGPWISMAAGLFFAALAWAAATNGARGEATCGCLGDSISLRPSRTLIMLDATVAVLLLWAGAAETVGLDGAMPTSFQRGALLLVAVAAAAAFWGLAYIGTVRDEMQRRQWERLSGSSQHRSGEPDAPELTR